MNSLVYLVEPNYHGAWVVYGALGVRQYYYYTKAQAIALYESSCKGIIFFEKKKRKGQQSASEKRVAEILEKHYER